jgi:hypothetical protein
MANTMPRTLRALRAGCAAALAALCALAAAPAHANVGPPMLGGDLVAEPTGLETIDVASETLEIDLRPLAQAQPARISATYQLDNRGQGREVELMFVTLSPRVSSFEVTLNGEYIEPNTQLIDATSLPAAWQPPAQTPGLNGAAINYFPSGKVNSEVAVALFKPDIPAGPSTLTVRYEAEAVRYMGGGLPTDQWQLAYSLAPARSWASFGQLDVSVLAPPGWQVAAEPPLTRQGDALSGTFNGVPADAIALTTRAPEPALYRIAAFVLPGLLVVILAGGLAALLRLGWLRGRGGKGVVLAALGLALLWAALVLIIGMAGVLVPPGLLPPLQANDYGYERAFTVIGVVVLAGLAAIVGFAGAVVAGLLARGRAQAQP